MLGDSAEDFEGPACGSTLHEPRFADLPPAVCQRPAGHIGRHGTVFKGRITSMWGGADPAVAGGPGAA